MIINKLGPVAVALLIIVIGLLVFVSLLILLRRDLDTNKVQSLTKLTGSVRLPDTFFSAEHPLEDTLRNIGLLRNLVVRAMPRAGSLPWLHQQLMGVLLDSFILAIGLSIVLIAAEAYSFNGTSASRGEMVFAWIWLSYGAVVISYWTLVGRSFSSAQTFEAWWTAGRTIGLFVALVLSVVAAVSIPGQLNVWLGMRPESSAWVGLALGGSTAIWLIGGYIVAARLGRTDGLEQAHYASVLGSAGRHPRDLIAAVEETASKEPGNVRKWFKMGSWDPIFVEHQNLAAGEFKVSLQAETAIVFTGYAAAPIERSGALASFAIGMLATIAASIAFYRFSLGLPFLGFAGGGTLFSGFSYLVFGFVLRKIGLMVLSELGWEGDVFRVDINGSFGERRQGAFGERGYGHYDSGMRTTYRGEISALAVRSTSFALPEREEAAFERFITGSAPESNIAEKLRDVIAGDLTPASEPTLKTIEHRDPLSGS